jgi:lysophospholipase L1-like esterase
VKRAAKILGLALLVAVALLAIAEGVARACFEQPVRPWIDHPFWQVSRDHRYHGPRFDADFPDQKFEYYVNPLGMRGHSLTKVEREPGTFRVVFLGGSTTENMGTPEEFTFPALVEKGLAESLKGQLKVEVGNAGLMGARTTHTLVELAIRIPPLRPDMVFVLDGGNDLLDSMRPEYDPTTEDLRYAPRPDLGDWLFWKSRLYAVTASRWGIFRERAMHEIIVKQASRRAMDPYEKPAKDAAWNIPAFEAALVRMTALASCIPTRIVFMTQPSLYKDPLPPEEAAVLWMGHQGAVNLDPKFLLEGMHAYNDALRKVARERGVLLVDLEAAVPKDLENFFDDVHLTRKGNAAVARAILAALDEAKIPAR